MHDDKWGTYRITQQKGEIMNKVILMGRLCQNPEVRTSKETTIARYTLAVDRRVARGKQETDYIPCVAFTRKAEFAEKYLRKGTKILVTGRIQTGSYTNREGQKIYTTDVVVENQEFVEKKQPEPQNDEPQNNDFEDIPDDEELPFN